MCGIIGVIGNCDKCTCHSLLINGLKQLQNRGYDSAGICTFSSNQVFNTDKFASTETSQAVTRLSKEDVICHHKNATIGIAHTRWATHGAKTDINAHPHLSMNKQFSVVHNGIIENYQELKIQLQNEGFIFQSETDTEIVVNLICSWYKKLESAFSTEKKIIEQSIVFATRELRGTYALAILSTLTPDILYCIRNGSPLLVGITDNFAIVTSEQSGFDLKMVSYYALDNNNLCVISKENGKVEMYTHTEALKCLKANHACCSDFILKGYPHWTLKEINEQTQSSLRALTNGGRLLSEESVKLGGLESFKNILIPIKHLIILGCGTSFHAGLIASKYFKELSGFISVQVFDGAEFTKDDIPQSGTVGLLLLSQSGETSDLYRCIQIVRNDEIQDDVTLIGVINVVDSLIAREVDCGVYLNAGREVAVASTKAFTSQVIVLLLIALWFSQNRDLKHHKRVKYIADLRKLSQDIQSTITMCQNACDKIVPLFDNFESCFLLGKGSGEFIAKEGALKIKEISYIHAEGYSASALKHGPFALLKKDFPVVIIALDDVYYDKCINALEEIKSRHAKVILITNKTSDKEQKADYIIRLPKSKWTTHILSVIPLQILAYKLSTHRGIDPDFPRNLAKVVSVE